MKLMDCWYCRGTGHMKDGRGDRNTTDSRCPNCEGTGKILDERK